MTNETTATAGTTSSDTTAQSTAASEAAASAAATAAAATQQKPADSTAAKPAETTASAPAKDETKPAEQPKGDTKPDAKVDETAEAKAAREAAEAKAAEAPKAPEKYEAFTLPDGVKIPVEQEAKIVETAKALNLPQEGAQQLVNAALDMQKTFATNMDARISEVRAQWETDSLNDKEFGGDNFNVNLAIANTAVNAFGSPAFKALLKDSGVGNHPEFIRTFLNIGKSISQDTTVMGGNGTASAEATGFTAAASKLYGTKP